FYGASYHESMAGGSDDEQRTAAYRAENEARIGFLGRFKAPGKVLDVGCSTGLFASQLRAAGWDAMGSDISPYACARARELLGPDHVFEGQVEKLGPRLEHTLDAVTLMDVIEHFADVVTPLRAIASMLRPGGVLVLRTPTLHSPFYAIADLSYRLSAGKYTGAVLKIYHAEHFYFFNEESIRRLLESVGFEVLAIEPDPLRWDNFRTAELRHGHVVNAVLAAAYFAGRAAGRGHGMMVAARRRADARAAASAP
ncbi:MAG TPA: class I SAM-dependent methyltransferase, partial [Polyangiaceae bacterium]|nr:class I SAM-dependent methyltransferase [Polyangiaceae bacterium]